MEHGLFVFSLALCASLNMADGIITVAEIHLPGLTEANPIARFALKSPPLFLAMKAGISLVIFEGLDSVFKKHRTWAWIASAVLNIGLSYALIHNLHLVRSLRYGG